MLLVNIFIIALFFQYLVHCEQICIEKYCQQQLSLLGVLKLAMLILVLQFLLNQRFTLALKTLTLIC